MLKVATPSFARFTHAAKFAPEPTLLAACRDAARLDDAARQSISATAETLVTRIRREARPSLMEHFLAEYGLSSGEGVALMCLA